MFGVFVQCPSLSLLNSYFLIPSIIDIRAISADLLLFHSIVHFLYFNEILLRILIVDLDIHHGQGTQQIFYEDKRVMVFSIHRYEDGKFWPHLRESNFDHVGDSEGAGYNINITLNEVTFLTVIGCLLFIFCAATCTVYLVR
ncbi:hypothetical protein ANCCAN_27693 [Ancylostoma caninum]|uniref:Histone deacetylase domain-containing protein n=1 Tax=Ancylostoma caninum TaxID=29170 RepID=A0A368F6I1_ANCCA|nr:hypothetical protein ANCCAN_27693 [Ancylostoma caninum]